MRRVLADTSDAEDGSARKLRKVTRACDICKRKKKRCNGEQPCETCRHSRSSCTYDAQYTRGQVPPLIAASNRLTPPESVPSLETVQQRWTSPEAHRNQTSISGGACGGVSATPRLHSRASHLTDAIGIQPPERSDPPSRRLSPEPSEAIDGQYHGRASAHSFVGRAWERIDAPRRLQTDHAVDIDTDLFSYGDRRVQIDHSKPFEWPSLAVAEVLLQRYFDFASPTYRFLHKPLMAKWMHRCYTDPDNLITVRKALLLVVFASASLFQTDSKGNVLEADEQGWLRSEMLFTEAQRLLAQEKGPPRLESVQARFAAVHYLLSSSRPNRALYLFGSVVQLLQALGLHRRRHHVAQPANLVLNECQKRMFWCSFTLDKYISAIMGRPPLLQLEDTNQEMPAARNDEDLELLPIGQSPQVSRDCPLYATLSHAQLAQILSNAAKEQYPLTSVDHRAQIDVANGRLRDISEWQRSLHPLLSEVVHASSLIPPFRRQHSVLQLARLHAVMFVTRALLLRDHSHGLDPHYVESYHHALRACIDAAMETVEVIATFAQDGQMFASWWYTQYIAFTAVSILYIYVIQRRRDRIPESINSIRVVTDKESNATRIFAHACHGLSYLAQATTRNAPVFKYSIILEDLRAEAERSRMSATSNGSRAPPRTASDGNEAGYMAVQQSRQGQPSDPFVDNTPAHQPPANSDAQWPQSNMGDLQPWTDDFAAAGIFHDLIASPLDDTMDIPFWTQLDSLPLGTGFQPADYYG